MTTEVWGTYSVRDHCRPEAFVRDVLLFDKLAVPCPNPQVPGEWHRWRHPSRNDPKPGWNPGRLDQLLKVLGTADRPDAAGTPGYNGAKIVYPVWWSRDTYQNLSAKLVNAGLKPTDPYLATAMIVQRQVPEVVDAVVAYRSESERRNDLQLSRQPPADMSGYEAVVQLARPLLLPNPGSSQLDTLRRAVDLGRSPEYQALRDAYFEWFRKATRKLHPADPSDLDFRISPASLVAIRSQLEELYKQEQDVVRKLSGRKKWDRAEAGCMIVSTRKSCDGAAGVRGLTGCDTLACGA